MNFAVCFFSSVSVQVFHPIKSRSRALVHMHILREISSVFSMTEPNTSNNVLRILQPFALHHSTLLTEPNRGQETLSRRKGRGSSISTKPPVPLQFGPKKANLFVEPPPFPSSSNQAPKFICEVSPLLPSPCPSASSVTVLHSGGGQN